MEFVTSRNFALPTDAKKLSAGLWHNIWAKNQWPNRELQDGATLYWYEAPTECIVWRSRVISIIRFSYKQKDEVKKQLNLSVSQVAEAYFLDAPSSGYCLSYKIQAIERLNLPKPTTFRFPQLGWLRISKEVEKTWPALSALMNAPFVLPDEVTGPARLTEGATCKVTVNAYERNPEARRQCIEHHGTVCCVCGFNFGAVFGELAEGYIHVHHLKPLAEIGERYEVDPIADLRPVCPNCHTVIHLGATCRSIEEVRQLIHAARETREMNPPLKSPKSKPSIYGSP